MATTPETSRPEPAHAPAADTQFDELSGVYGFFRRHQKKLLYSAGLFTLLTFSITQPMMTLVGELFSRAQPMPSIVVNGQRVELTVEDNQFGTLLARYQPRVPAGVPVDPLSYQFYMGTSLPDGVMLPILSPDGDADAGTCFAILRRAAIAEGIGYSMQDVDLAIEREREADKAESAAKLAVKRGFSSLAQFREMVGEAMRVGNYMRLQLLALDAGPARVARELLADREKITLKVASFDEKAHQEQLSAATELAEAELRAWLDEKSDREKQRLAVYALPRAELRCIGLQLAEGGFDPAQWQETFLKDFTVDDKVLQSYYDEDKALRFKNEGTDNEFKPFEDESVKAQLTRIAQAERVMNELLGEVRKQQLDLLQPLTDALGAAKGEFATAQTSMQSTKKALVIAEGELTTAETALAANPEDAAQQAVVAEKKAAVQTAKEAADAAQAEFDAKQQAVKAAEDAQQAARAGFDLTAAATALTEGKSGFVVKSMQGAKNADELRDSDAAGLEFGQWPQAQQATSLQNVGDLGFGAGRTEKAIVLYQATAVDPKPMKEWAELEPLLKDAYWTEKAKAVGVEKRKAMEDALLRLAKEQMPEFLAEKEAGRQARIDEKVTEWETRMNADIADAEQKLTVANLAAPARRDYEQKLEARRRELASKEAQVQRFTRAVEMEIEGEVKTEALKHYAKVLDAAAAEAGFTVADIGPHARDLASQPRFDKRFDATVVYLWQNQSKLKEGEATAVLQDPTARRLHVAVCTAVAPLTFDDVTRREFEALRQSPGRPFARVQMLQALQYAFSRKALEARYGYEVPVGTQVEPSPR